MGLGSVQNTWMLILIVIGPMLAINCIKALHQDKGMYDHEGTNYILLGTWIGVIIGLAATVWAAWLMYQISR